MNEPTISLSHALRRQTPSERVSESESESEREREWVQKVYQAL